MFKKLTYGFLMLMLPFIGMGDVLRWMVNDTATVDGTDIKTFLSPYVEDEDNWNAVRVKISGGGLTEPVILRIYSDPYTTYEGDWGVNLYDNGSGYWGSGVPTGNQSPLDFIDATILSEYVIQAQLGHNTWDYTLDDAVWETIAETRPETLTQAFIDAYTYERFDINPSDLGVWTPTEFYTSLPIPEPSSALLVLIGVGFLGLKRRRGC